MFGLKAEAKRVVGFMVFWMIVMLIMLAVMIAPANGQEAINHEYDHAVGGLSNYFDEFMTTARLHNNEPIPPIVFEDGSWVSGGFVGCLQGWPCDSDGAFAVDWNTCITNADGVNEILLADGIATRQIEQSCSGTISGTLLELSSGILTITTIEQGNYIVYLPIVTK